MHRACGVLPAAVPFPPTHTWLYSCSSLCRECRSCLLSANCCWSKLTSCCSLNTHHQRHSLSFMWISPNHNDLKWPVTQLKQLSLHEASLHLVSLTCCCAPESFVCLVAVVGFVDFAHSCASAASSTPPSIAPPLTPPLTPPAAGEHAQTAPPP